MYERLSLSAPSLSLDKWDAIRIEENGRRVLVVFVVFPSCFFCRSFREKSKRRERKKGGREG